MPGLTLANVGLVGVQRSLVPVFLGNDEGGSAVGAATTHTFNSPLNSLLTGDIVVVAVSYARTSVTNFTVSGNNNGSYTNLLTNSLYSNGSDEDVSVNVFYKVMGATPDTSITITPASTSSSAAMPFVIQAWRNISGILATPTPTTATGTILSDADFLMTPASIATDNITINNPICVVVGLGHSQGALTTYTPTSFTNIWSSGLNASAEESSNDNSSGSTGNDSTVAIAAFKWDGSSNPFQPSNFDVGGVTTETNGAKASITFVLQQST